MNVVDKYHIIVLCNLFIGNTISYGSLLCHLFYVKCSIMVQYCIVILLTVNSKPWVVELIYFVMVYNIISVPVKSLYSIIRGIIL